jgi:hypothetical protein
MPFLTRFSILSLSIHIFVGLLGHGSQASENNDSIALFQSEASNMGMIYGNSLEGNFSNNVFYDNGTSDIPSANAIGLTVKELKDVSSYPTSWDFIGKMGYFTRYQSRISNLLGTWLDKPTED